MLSLADSSTARLTVPPAQASDRPFMAGCEQVHRLAGHIDEPDAAVFAADRQYVLLPGVPCQGQHLVAEAAPQQEGSLLNKERRAS